MDRNIFKKFSENLKKVLVLSETLAREENKPADTEHLLLAMVTIKNTLAYEILSGLNITPERIKLVMALSNPNPGVVNKNQVSDDTKKVIQHAVQIASKYGHYWIDCEHLLLALAKNKKLNSFSVLSRIGVKPEEIISQIEEVFDSMKDASTYKKNQIDEGFFSSNDTLETEGMEQPGSMPIFGPNPTLGKIKKESILETFATNLTLLASQNKLDSVIGRSEETARLIQILSRRTKNNPVLIGEPGVGKTAIIEGLAQKISSGTVSSKLLGKDIFSLDIGSLIAGTMYRGQFEGRVKKLLSEIKKRGNVILFIDEIHTVIGAGSTEGSVDAANLLKPMLARDELKLIGSTTFDEYKKHIEKDPAFERRLQPVHIKEATVGETIEILNGIKEKYEQHHDVTYSPDALISAAKLSKRYINDRFLPDKAIDLIDEAAASIESAPSKEEIKLLHLKKELRELLKKKDDFIVEEKYKEATLLRKREMVIEEKIRELRAISNNKNKTIIDSTIIAKIVSRWTGIPVSDLNLQEKKKYLNLEREIKKRIIGQDEAIKEVSKAIKRSRVGISNPNRPTGSFIFLGPSGVGKSELAKTISKELLGSEKSLIKIDMSEFMERHNISRLIGAPAGYIGYEEGGKLTEVVRKNPYSIILFDEIEKAHPEVFNILLQVMEDGELTDSKGRRIDFKNTIIIMTSNLGTDALTKQASIGFNQSDLLDDKYKKLEKDVLSAVEKHFKPEFINRLDKIIVFRPLDKKSIRKIVDLEIDKLLKRLNELDLTLTVEKDARDWIAEKGFNPTLGARPVRNTISDCIESQISDMVLGDKIKNGDKITVILNKGKIVLQKTA